ncbi:hypothetical protein DK846_03520 [Methanospirillum lacunae]|uniref:PAS domain-containing protein n=2 Tax=Methanospirillum lacunae TaxID=668570 RepID=A0A2V2N296_9EURY|nr:hypothetical protein DK846_03520 [Methanospirillum lacunae]
MSQISRILEFLKDHPEGACVSEISAALEMNRNYAAKFLTILYRQGQIDLRIYGKTRLYQICNRVPFHAICLISNGVTLGIDRLGIIRKVSGSVETLLYMQIGELLGVLLKSLNHPVLTNNDILNQVRFLIDRKGGKPYHQTIKFRDKMLRITLISCIFDDAMTGVAMQITDFTSWHIDIELIVGGKNNELHLIQESKEFIISIGPDEKIIFANHAYAKYCGLAIQELIGRQGLPYLSSYDMSQIRGAYLISHPSIPSSPVHVTAILPDGEKHWQKWSIFPIFINNKLHQVHLHGKDISKLKYLEQEIQELRQEVAHILKEKNVKLRDLTLQLKREIENRIVIENQYNNQINFFRSLLCDHQVIILETDISMIITSAIIPDQLSHIISNRQLVNYPLQTILLNEEKGSNINNYYNIYCATSEFRRVFCHIRTCFKIIPVITSGIPLKRLDGEFEGMCIIIEFPSLFE